MRPMVNRRRAAWIPLLAVAGLLTVTACGGGSAAGDARAESAAVPASFDELVNAATEEGSVLVYTSLAPMSIDKMTQGFESKYPGITVTVQRGNSADTMPKVEAELALGAGDAGVILDTNESWMNELGDTGSLLDPSGGPSMGGQNEYDRDKNLGSNSVFAVGQGGTTFAWNTDAVPGGLASYEDILDPSLKGKVGILDANLAPVIAQHYIWLDEQYPGYTEKLAAQQPRIYATTAALGEGMNSGEIAAGDFASVWELISAKGKGAPVDYAYDEIGIQGNLYFGGIPTSTNTPNAARLFADYVVSKDGQTAIFGDAGSAIIPGIGQTADLPKVAPKPMTPEEFKEYLVGWNNQFRR